MRDAHDQKVSASPSRIMILVFCVFVCVAALVSPLVYYVYTHMGQKDAVLKINRIATREVCLFKTQQFYEDYDYEFFRSFIDVSELRVSLSEMQGADSDLFTKIMSVPVLRIDCDVADNRDLVKTLLELDGIETLVLSGAYIEQRHLDLIHQLSDLKALAISSGLLTDGFIESLVGLKELEVLSLGNCPQVSDAIYESLAQIPSLRHLKLICSRLTCSNIEKLGSIESLYVLNCPLRPDFFNAVSRLKWLKSLTIASCPVQGSTAALGTLAYLERLELMTSGLNYADIAWILESTNFNKPEIRK